MNAIAPLTAEAIAELRRLADNATPGPWLTEPPTGDVNGFAIGTVIAATAPGKSNRVYANPPGGSYPSNDRLFIAAARSALPALLSELEQSRVERKEIMEALESAIMIAGVAQEEWDKAPAGMRAGKILIALSGHLPRYRADIDAIHAALSRARQRTQTGG